MYDKFRNSTLLSQMQLFHFFFYSGSRIMEEGLVSTCFLFLVLIVLSNQLTNNY